MGLIQAIKFKFESGYEIGSEDFYLNFLSQDDAQELRPFVSGLGDRLSVHSAILAVGSSVFPKIYWIESRIKNIYRPKSDKIPIGYKDIDLLIIPEEKVLLSKLEDSVSNALNDVGMSFELKNKTIMGQKYDYVPCEYGLHSIQTKLNNGTKLDLILGRADLLEQTASQKIAEEKNEKCAFSVLYKK
jgi:hypothetical protein